ncbi:MAG TPA: DUF2911 domain-containing protein [Candidatus Binatia bacterium]|nr:DUF2911 domain-containing protein [Candidatus Binatia bacterium]
MLKSRSWMFVLLALAGAAAVTMAQEKRPPLSPPGQATLTFADGKTVTIEYSRPSMRNRKIFGGLVPYDQVWRTGANAATTLKTDADLTIGGTAVPAGSYTLYTLPGTNTWQLIINKQTGQWGTEYSQGQDLARIPMKVTQRPSGLEMFTISFDRTSGDSATLKLEWENTIASADVKERK